MSMKAYIHTDACGNIVVRMEGGLDHTSSSKLRGELLRIQKKNPGSLITLYMNNLDFVGSSGIGHLVETIKILNKKDSSVRLSNLRPEFVKVFKLYQLDVLAMMMEDFEDDDTANMGRFFNRNKTFQN
ncbi:MAG: STAS domain-containing protein [Halobacteriovoraceae bacterium]|nr:STAS domain-containing protein [Halobacteriovoraceae bacterium]